MTWFRQYLRLFALLILVPVLWLFAGGPEFIFTLSLHKQAAYAQRQHPGSGSKRLAQFLSELLISRAYAQTSPSPADLIETADVRFTQAIIDQAASLENDPVKIYNWVRENIQFVPSYGSLLGSDLCLQRKACNAFDTASLLIALYRVSNIPARYVRGTIRVPIEQFQAATPEEALASLVDGGIPATVVKDAADTVTDIQFEHVWVKAFVDYVPSRAEVSHEGDQYVPMDAAFKLLDSGGELVPQDAPILLGTLPYEVVSVTEESAILPDSLRTGATPPTVEITGIVNIGNGLYEIRGTATDSNLASYAIEYALEGSEVFIPLTSASGPVEDGVLGILNANTLENGLYTIRLTATDSFGVFMSSSISHEVTGDLKIGKFTLAFEDLTIPVSGLPITISRIYNSYDKSKGAFGIGWSLNLSDVKLQEDLNHNVILTLPGGKRARFSFEMRNELSFGNDRFGAFQYLRAAWVPEPGVYDELEIGGTIPHKELILYDGTQNKPLFFNQDTSIPFDCYTPPGYVLTQKDGTKLFIEKEEIGFQLFLDPPCGQTYAGPVYGSGEITKIEELNGNTLTFSDEGIIHSSGKSVIFERDDEDRITKITDPMGNELHFSYDERGDLVAFTDQEGNTTRYTYDDRHNLIDVIDPRGVRAIRTEYDDSGRMSATTDANGKRIEITHDSDNKQEIVRDRLGNPTIYGYDHKGNVVSETNALGHTTSYSYDENDNLLSKTDPLGRTATKSYDADGNMLSSTDFEGNTVTMTYNEHGQVLTITDALGKVTTKTYDDFGNLLEISDADGSNSFTYDTNGNLMSATDLLGQVAEYTYDAEGNLATMIDANGNSASFAYDQSNRLLESTQMRTLPDGSIESLTTGYRYDATGNATDTIDKLGNIAAMTNNAIGRLGTVTDRRGNTIQYSYDALGNMSDIVYSDGSRETFTYDAEGRQLSHTDRDGHTAQYEYDALGRKTKIIYPDGSTIALTYDPVGRMLSKTDERGNVTSYSYDVRQKTITDALGNVTIQEFDQDGPPVRVGSEGNLIKLTDARGNVTSYTYKVGRGSHGRGLLTQTTYPDGNTSRIEYDAADRKIAEIALGGIRAEFEYDYLGRLIRVRDALGNETSYTYDEVGNHIATTDAKGNTTRLEYNALGGLVKRILPLGQEESFNYDANGNLISYTNFNGQTTTFEYDNDNRFVQKQLPEGTTETFSYSSEGFRLTAGAESYTYNSRGWLLTANTASGEVISYSYDTAGNRTAIATPSGTTSYSYDKLNRLESVTAPDGGVTSYSYDAVGNLLSITYPNDVVTSLTYDALNRVTQIETRDRDSLLLASYSYTLGATGDVLRVVEAPSGRSVDYSYDANRQLLSEVIHDPADGQRTISYSYDTVGNRLSKNDSVEGVTSYSYDANNRLLTGEDSSGITHFSYNDNGNLIARNGPGIDISYRYDSQNRLIRIDSDTDVIEYSYDIDGILICTTVNGNKITNFLIDKNLPLAQVVRETDGMGVEIASYVYGHDLIGMLRPDTGNSYYHYDRQFSTRQLSNNVGAIQDFYTYDAFGVLLSSTDITNNHYLYTGERFERNSGLYYLRTRYYNPTFGRFTTTDPFKGNKQNPKSLHDYLYAQNQPINFQDPSGLFSIAGIMAAVSLCKMMTSLADSSYLSLLKPVNTTSAGGDTTKLSWGESIIVWRALEMAKRLTSLQNSNWNAGFHRWFGPYTFKRLRFVKQAIRKMTALASDNSLEFIKDPTTGSEAYVYQGISLFESTIFLGTFFKKTGNQMAGIIIHELAHLADKEIVDHFYGYEESLWGAKADSEYGTDFAIKNAENYMYHAVGWAMPLLPN